MNSPNTPENGGRKPGLIPTLGLFTTIMMVIGGVIGSGIFRKAGVMAAAVGSPEILLWVWFIAGTITLFGALTNAEVASIIPETGGQYIFFEQMFGPFFAYLYGWAIFAIIQTGSIAAVACVFAEYASQLIPLPQCSATVAAFSIHLPFIGDITPLNDIGVKVVAISLVLGLTIVNYLGVALGGVVQNILTVAKLVAMAVLVLGAFLLPTGGSFSNITTASQMIHPTGLAMVAAIFAALQGAFWAYDGWNKITYIAGEIKNPQKNIPIGLGVGMLAVMGIYLLINLAYSYVLPIDAMAHSKLVAADVAEKCFRGGGRWIAAAVMLSTFGTTNALVLASARVYYSMGQKGVFPRFLGTTHPKFHTPAASLIAQFLWCIVLVISGTFDTLTDTLILVSWIFYAVGAYGIFVLRWKMPDVHRPYKVPGYPWVPIIFILFAITYVIFTIKNDLDAYHLAISQGKPAIINSALGIALVLIGTSIYAFYRLRPQKPSTTDEH